MHSLFFDVIYHSISGPGGNEVNSDNDQMNLAYALFAIMVKVVTLRHFKTFNWPKKNSFVNLA